MSEEKQVSPARAAAIEYMNRQDRSSHPSGEFDNAGRWYPDKTEWTPSCDSVRSPSRAWPYSQMVHCRTAEHVAELFDVEKKDLMAEVRLIKKEQEAEKAVQAAPKPAVQQEREPEPEMAR